MNKTISVRLALALPLNTFSFPRPFLPGSERPPPALMLTGVRFFRRSSATTSPWLVAEICPVTVRPELSFAVNVNLFAMFLPYGMVV